MIISSSWLLLKVTETWTFWNETNVFCCKISHLHLTVMAVAPKRIICSQLSYLHRYQSLASDFPLSPPPCCSFTPLSFISSVSKRLIPPSPHLCVWGLLAREARSLETLNSRKSPSLSLTISGKTNSTFFDIRVCVEGLHHAIWTKPDLKSNSLWRLTQEMSVPKVVLGFWWIGPRITIAFWLLKPLTKKKKSLVTLKYERWVMTCVCDKLGL